MSTRIQPPPLPASKPRPFKRPVKLDEASLKLASKIGREAEKARRRRIAAQKAAGVAPVRRTKPPPKGVTALPNGTPVGRPPGAMNRVSTYLKMAITGAMEDLGEDGKGKDGTRGYMRYLARYEVPSFVGLVKRVMPVQVRADLDPDSLMAKLLQAAAAQRAVRANGGTTVIDGTATALPPPKPVNGS